jgi:hypothetical protein
MNLNVDNSQGRSGSEIDPESTGEDTLRLIASLAAPEGLEERVRMALRTAPRQGRLLAWPGALRSDAAWIRATAAAAIVMVVAGGGWGVYSHIQPWQPARAPVAPARLGGVGEFSGASAVRTPQTLQPPVVSPPPKSAASHPAQKKMHKKAATPAAQIPMAAPAPK